MDNSENPNNLSDRIGNINISAEINEILNETHDYYGYNYDSDDNDSDCDNGSDSESEPNKDNDNEWNEWREECDIDDQCICLFCDYSANITALKQHLLDRHEFKFDAIITDKPFYSRIKLINYIRQSVGEKRCHQCQQCFDSDEQLLSHFDSCGHSCCVPEDCVWDLDIYFNSSKSCDNLLHFLHSENDGDSN